MVVPLLARVKGPILPLLEPRLELKAAPPATPFTTIEPLLMTVPFVQSLAAAPRLSVPPPTIVRGPVPAMLPSISLIVEAPTLIEEAAAIERLEARIFPSWPVVVLPISIAPPLVEVAAAAGVTVPIPLMV